MILDAVGTRMQSAYLLSAVALGIAWAFTAVLARRSASVRHHIWAVALTVSIAAPVAREIVPRLDLPLLRPDAAVSALPSTRVTIVDRARPETVGNEHTLPAAWSIAAIEAIVWLAGAVPLLCVRTLRRARLSRLAAEASDVDGQVDVRSHHGVRVPMLAGLRQAFENASRRERGGVADGPATSRTAGYYIKSEKIVPGRSFHVDQSCARTRSARTRFAGCRGGCSDSLR